MVRIVKIPDGREFDLDNLPSLDSVLDEAVNKLAEKRGLNPDFIKNGNYFEVQKALGFYNRPIGIPVRGQYITSEEVKAKRRELIEYINKL